MTSKTGNPVSEDDLHAFVDGRLDASRAEQVRTHLDADGALAGELGTWRANEAALSELLSSYAYAAPSDIPQRPNWLKAKFENWPAMVAALLVAFGLGGGVGYLARGSWPLSGQGELVGSDEAWLEVAARDVFLTYVREVRHPVEVDASERDHLVNWLGNRIEKPFTAPSLADLGFELVGGRLLPIGGKPGAMLMYENANGDRATILMARNAGARDTAFRFSEDLGVNTFRWIDGPLAYAISGFLDRGALEDISREVYAHFETI
ncbi:anti-sigma factor family protein [Pelagibacterium sp.]|uniref:anti-sigma factor family protein n=1 Tax=Pelagibacterium sp. TaxID=1967288 RepID=UPI003A94BF71